jgi:hypothetical protein
MSSSNSLPAVPLDPEVHERLLVEAYRRARGTAGDIREAMRAIAERALGPVLDQLELEELDANGQPVVPPGPPPPPPKCGPLLQWGETSCVLHGATVARGTDVVCPVTGDVLPALQVDPAAPEPPQ